MAAGRHFENGKKIVILYVLSQKMTSNMFFMTIYDEYALFVHSFSF